MRKSRKKFRTFGPGGYVGCTPADLRQHLESLWLPGMSWENYGPTGWHIDHQKPISSFNFFNSDGSMNDAQIRAAMHYTNLQPLWAADNVAKSNKLIA